jgi:predicted neuraminidase
MKISCVGCFLTYAAIHAATAFAAQPGLVKSEFVFESVPFASCHASTIVETAGGKLVTAFFAGSSENHPDVGIWVSRLVDGKWTAPVEAANGVQAEGPRQPCWNPVLFQPKSGPLLLFYKVGPSPSRWWGMLRTSDDDGKTWSESRRLPDGILGPIKNKPIQLAGGDLLCASSTEHDGWRVHFERTSDLGRTWTGTEPINDGRMIAAIQPSILFRGDAGGDKLLAVGRTRQKHIFRTTSEDGGKTWSPLTLTALPNPNSGIDAVTLADGRQLLVYNHTDRDRSPLNVAVSRDAGAIAASSAVVARSPDHATTPTDGLDAPHWQAALVLENEPLAEFSYPAVIQTRDGLVHCTYTWLRKRIRHVVLDPTKFSPRDFKDGQWPKAEQ